MPDSSHKLSQAKTIAAIALPVLLTLLTTTNLHASTEDDLKAQLEKKQKAAASISQKLSDITAKKDSIAAKIATLSSQLNITQAQVDDLQKDIDSTEQQLDVINKMLGLKKDSLQEKIDLRNRVVRNYVKRSILNDLELFTVANGFGLASMSQMFNKTLGNETVNLITSLNIDIANYEKDKAEAQDLKNQLEGEQAKILALKNQLVLQQNNAKSEKSTLEKQQNNLESDLAKLNSDISALDSKLQAILAEKSGDSSSSVGDYEPPEASLPNPTFSPAFAGISYGAYTHGNGMSQYGAKGRAMAGQDYKEILKFYYKVGVKTDSDFPKSISVSGYGSMDFQKYLYGIAEMPSDWPMDALKAQAIAARTYANKSKKPICTTEACQVFLKSKSSNPPAKWKQAVDETKGMILDGAATSQYSSTTGGYINNVGWDTSGSWPGGSYEKKAGSPWFYKAWYTKSYSTSSDKCGKSSPWLKESEMADILNSWVVWKKGSGSDRNRISPVTTSCWGGNPYSLDDMASKADDLDGGKFTSVSDISVDVSNGGFTRKVTVSTNRGTFNIDGAEFKTVFNLRAPGYISLKNKLFDMIRR